MVQRSRFFLSILTGLWMVALPVEARVLSVPIVRAHVDVAGSTLAGGNSTVNCPVGPPPGAPYFPVGSCSMRVRYNLENISPVAQTITILGRAPTSLTTWASGTNSSGQKRTLGTDKTLATFKLDPLTGQNPRGALLLDLTCTAANSNTTNCTIQASYGGADGEGGSPQTILTASLGSQGGDFLRDMSCTFSNSISIQVTETRGAIVGSYDVMNTSAGGYFKNLSGTTDMLINGGRPF